MPTESFDSGAFFLFNVLGGAGCIQLDLSTGVNQFDLSNLNNPNSQCNQVLTAFIPDPNIRARLIAEIKAVLGSISFTIPEFDAGRLCGSIRLSHLVMQGMTLGWSAADNGSIVLLVELNERPGEQDIQGSNCSGDLTNAQLRIYLPVGSSGLDCRGQPAVSAVAATFDMNISLHTNDGAPIPDAFIPKGQIRDTVTSTVQAALLATDPGQTVNRATLLLRAVLANLYASSGSPTPPADTVFYELTVGNNSATLKWADTLRYARVTVDSIQPDRTGLAQLSLILGAGYYRFTIPPIPPINATNYCVASTGTGFGLGQHVPLPLSVSNVPLPDGIPLEVDCTLIERIILPFVPVTIGHVHDWWTSPTYGAGSHTDQDGPFVVTYHIDVQNQPFP
jgi:hypothetical protein